MLEGLVLALVGKAVLFLLILVVLAVIGVIAIIKKIA